MKFSTKHSWEPSPLYDFPKGKKLQTRILGYRSVRFLRRQDRWKEEAKTHMHEKFQFFTGRTSFYRTSAVLFTGDGEGKKIKVGLPEKVRAHAYPHL